MKIALKTIVLWLIIVVIAIVNGIVRDKLAVPILGVNIALPLSGILLSMAAILVIYISIPFFGNNTKFTFVFVGIGLVSMTLTFEFLFGHYLMGKSWISILQVFNIVKGDLFVLVLCASLLSPYFAAKFRGYIQL